MGVAYHKPNPLGFERAAHALFHAVEDRLKGLFEIRLGLFNVRAVAHKVLSHCCPLLSEARRSRLNSFRPGSSSRKRKRLFASGLLLDEVTAENCSWDSERNCVLVAFLSQEEIGQPKGVSTC